MLQPKLAQYLQDIAFKNSRNGYYYVRFGSRNRGAKNREEFVMHPLHRLIATKYIPYPAHKGKRLDVNHKDGNKGNNKIDNLEWVTRSENIKHAYKRNLRTPAWTGCLNEKHPGSKPIYSVDTKTGEVTHYPSAKEAKRHGFSDSHISSCIAGRRKTHSGKRWFFNDRDKIEQ